MNGQYSRPSLNGNSDTVTPRLDFLPNRDNVGLAGAGTIRYNPVNAKMEASNNGGAFFEIGAAGAGISAINAGNNIVVTGTGSSTTVATVTNPTFSGTVTAAAGHLTVNNAYDGTSATFTVPSNEAIYFRNSGGGVALNGGTIYAKTLAAFTPPGGPIGVTDAIEFNGSASAKAGLTVLGNITVTGTVAGRNVSADGTALDTVVGRVNQALLTSSTPAFNAVTINRGQLKPHPSIGSDIVLNNTVSGGSIRIATLDSDHVAFAGGAIYIKDIRAYATALNLKNDMTCDSGIKIDGRDISVDGATLDTVASRVNQALNSTSTPTFNGLTVNGDIAVTGTVDGRDIAFDGTKIDYLTVRVDQDVTQFGSPVFHGVTSSNGLFVSSGNITVAGTVDGRDVSADGAALDTVVGRVNQPLLTSSSPAFSGLTVSGGTLVNTINGANANFDNIGSYLANWTRYGSLPAFSVLANEPLASSYLGSNTGVVGPTIGNGTISGLGSQDWLWFFGRNGSTGRRYYQISSTAYFTGQHAGNCPGIDMTNIDEYAGRIVCSDGTYVGGVSICESLPNLQLSSVPKQKTVFGVLSNVNNWNNSQMNDAEVAASGWDNGLKGMVRINSIGEGAIWVVSALDSEGQAEWPLENGDYICSSEVAGYGMRQDEPALYNYTVAKITQDMAFGPAESIEIESDGKTYRAAFVGCTYHCG